MTSNQNEAVTSRAGALHQSTITSLLEGCSMQWALVNLLGEPDPAKPASSAGTAFHTAVERHEEARKLWHDTAGAEGSELGLPYEEMQEIIRQELAQVVPVIPDRFYATDRKTGIRLTPEGVPGLALAALEGWYYKPAKETGKTGRDFLLEYKPLEIEPYFKSDLVTGALPLGGWADGVYQHLVTGKIIIVDEKTASNASFTRWNALEHKLQATMYTVLALLDGRYGAQNLEDLEFWFLVNRTAVGKTAQFARAKHLVYQASMEDVVELGEQVRLAQQVIDTEDFKINPMWGALCSQTYCPFWSDCVGAPEGNGKFRKSWKQLKLEVINNV